MCPSVSTFNPGHGTHFDTFMSEPDVNDSLHSSNGDLGVGTRELRKGRKALSMESNSRSKRISLSEIIFVFLIIAELITRMVQVLANIANFPETLFHHNGLSQSHSL